MHNDRLEKLIMLTSKRFGQCTVVLMYISSRKRGHVLVDVAVFETLALRTSGFRELREAQRIDVFPTHTETERMDGMAWRMAECSGDHIHDVIMTHRWHLSSHGLKMENI